MFSLSDLMMNLNTEFINQGNLDETMSKELVTIDYVMTSNNLVALRADNSIGKACESYRTNNIYLVMI
jgi:hypothetical protein